MSAHVVSVTLDPERPYEFEVWCSCTRFGAVGQVRRAWYRFAGSIGDDPEVWFDRYDQAVAFVEAGHV